MPVISRILNVLTLVTDILIVGWLLISAFRFIYPLRRVYEIVARTIGPQARILAFVIALVATSGSLFFSEVAKYTPCLLCWYQRIAMYPQVVILGISIAINDRKGLIYAAALSVAGVVLAAYHYYIQLSGATILPCSAVGYSAQCSQRFATEYGYITIPMMSLSAFVAILILLQLYRKHGTRI